MNQTMILQPMVVMVALTLGVALWMLRLRFKAVADGQLSPGYFKHNRGGKVPDYLARVTQNFDNLLELPPLFYIACVILYLLHAVDGYTLALAWAYVASRLLHSAIHTTYNQLYHRMSAFLVSCLLLGMLWGELGRQVFTAG